MSSSETTPLLPTHSNSSSITPSHPQSIPSRPSPKPPRSVTFNPQVTTSSPPNRRPGFPSQSQSGGAIPQHHPAGVATSSSSSASNSGGLRDGTQPMLSALNSKLRRRNSSGAPLVLPAQHPASKIGPQRTTRTAQKLKLLPNPEQEAEEAARLEDEAEQREVYSQFTRIKDPTARRDAARLGKEDRIKLPRVTAYCTAGSYKMEELMRFLKGRGKTKAANPKLFDECIYSPYRYRVEREDGGDAARGESRNHDDGQERRRRSLGDSGAGKVDTVSERGVERESDEGVSRIQSQPVRRFSDSAIEVEENAQQRREDLIDFQRSGEDEEASQTRQSPNNANDNANQHHPNDHPSETALESPSAESPLHGSSSAHHHSTSDLTHEPSTTATDPATPLHRPITPDFDTTIHIPEIFLFEYGVVVLWGMTPREEQRFLKEIARFENEKLAKDDVQTEEFNFYYTREYQARIYNDFISLREKRNYMTKLAISHALAQSTKTSLYEDLLSTTITTTQSIPSTIARTGRINLTRREINMQIGELFILRINIHLQGSVLDAPELMWAEPQLEPVYQAVRSYLEMDQRVELMQERVSVVGDLLAVLKDQLSHTHGEYLEWIVIVLIAAEILVAAINIVVDLYAGVD
ncbi:DUF155-domain-containing protein [Hortaea werneckii]|nr:DUF155-domain-containing protein [Hortaea werneckii]